MTVTDELALLQGARLKGRLTPEAAAIFVGDRADALLRDLQRRELVKVLAAGTRLTPAGRDRLAELLAAERAQLDTAAVARLYEEFEDHNTLLKEIVSAWQIRPDGTPNDHTDAAYDQQVIARLADAHRAAAPLVARIGGAAPRLAGYAGRFETAIAMVRQGHHRWIANPLADSYHQVWFELHEDLIGMLGLVREDEAKAGRA
jgi:pyruvate, orthophosphate dikinase